MTNFAGLSSDSGLSDVFNLFPRNSAKLMRLLNDIMCADGALSRGEREAVASFISKQNTTPYCVFYHSVFSEVFSGPIEETSQRIQPLLTYALGLHAKDAGQIREAFDAARKAGWSEGALYEVVEVCGIFDFINNIVLAAGLDTPEGPMEPYPTVDGLKGAYNSMADAVGK